jgi:hypothetical protein
MTHFGWHLTGMQHQAAEQMRLPGVQVTCQTPTGLTS